ncbi:hypothetical protein HBB16_13380 [Pseudonocardia sp. MCCB 268]|nr:hypothetical protein [Pseudonocardia cytotoxica]
MTMQNASQIRTTNGTTPCQYEASRSTTRSTAMILPVRICAGHGMKGQLPVENRQFQLCRDDGI